MVKEHCLAINDRRCENDSGNGIFDGVTLGMVSEMSDDIVRINLYNFSYNIEMWDIFY